MDWAGAFCVGDEPDAIRVGGCQCPHDGGERVGLLEAVGDGLGDAFCVGDEPGTVRLGGCQWPRDSGERAGLLEVAGDGLGDAFRVGQVSIAVSMTRLDANYRRARQLTDLDS